MSDQIQEQAAPEQASPEAMGPSPLTTSSGGASMPPPSGGSGGSSGAGGGSSTASPVQMRSAFDQSGTASGGRQMAPPPMQLLADGPIQRYDEPGFDVGSGGGGGGVNFYQSEQVAQAMFAAANDARSGNYRESLASYMYANLTNGPIDAQNNVRENHPYQLNFGLHRGLLASDANKDVFGFQQDSFYLHMQGTEVIQEGLAYTPQEITVQPGPNDIFIITAFQTSSPFDPHTDNTYYAVIRKLSCTGIPESQILDNYTAQEGSAPQTIDEYQISLDLSQSAIADNVGQDIVDPENEDRPRLTSNGPNPERVNFTDTGFFSPTGIKHFFVFDTVERTFTPENFPDTVASLDWYLQVETSFSHFYGEYPNTDAVIALDGMVAKHLGTSDVGGMNVTFEHAGLHVIIAFGLDEQGERTETMALYRQNFLQADETNSIDQIERNQEGIQEDVDEEITESIPLTVYYITETGASPVTLPVYAALTQDDQVAIYDYTPGAEWNSRNNDRNIVTAFDKWKDNRQDDFPVGTIYHSYAGEESMVIPGLQNFPAGSFETEGTTTLEYLTSGAGLLSLGANIMGIAAIVFGGPAGVAVAPAFFTAGAAFGAAASLGNIVDEVNSHHVQWGQVSMDGVSLIASLAGLTAASNLIRFEAGSRALIISQSAGLAIEGVDTIILLGSRAQALYELYENERMDPTEKVLLATQYVVEGAVAGYMFARSLNEFGSSDAAVRDSFERATDGVETTNGDTTNGDGSSGETAGDETVVGTDSPTVDVTVPGGSTTNIGTGNPVVADSFIAETGLSATPSSHPDLLTHITTIEQGTGAYVGIDDWAVVQLDAGTRMARGAPGDSNFFTTVQDLGDNPTRGETWRGLQVDAHHLFGYRPGMIVVELDTTQPVGVALTTANPQFGGGGRWQIYVEGGSALPAVENIELSAVNSLGPVADSAPVRAIVNEGLMTESQLSAVMVNDQVHDIYSLETLARHDGVVSGDDIVRVYEVQDPTGYMGNSAMKNEFMFTSLLDNPIIEDTTDLYVLLNHDLINNGFDLDSVLNMGVWSDSDHLLRNLNAATTLDALQSGGVAIVD